MKITKILALLLCGALSLGFVACGDDDDEPSVSGTPEPQISTTEGTAVRIYSAPCGIWFDYDDNGRLTGFSDGEFDFEIQGNKFVCVSEDSYYEWDHKIRMEFSLNGDGLISYAKGEFLDANGDLYYKQSSVVEISYNGKKQCTGSKLSGTLETNDEEDTDYYKLEGTETCNYTWQNDNMVKSVQNGKYDWEERNSRGQVTDKGTHNYRYTHEFEYSDTRNPLLQMPYALAEVLPVDADLAYEALSMLGLCGVGPAYLPYKRNYYGEEWEQGEEPDTRSWTDNYTYSLNSDGTIYKENDQYYSYSAIERERIASTVVRAAKSLRDQARSHRFGKRAARR